MQKLLECGEIALFWLLIGGSIAGHVWLGLRAVGL
jgi:hypothetical protein